MTAADMNELIYQQYPRKVGKVGALKAIEKSVKTVAVQKTGGDQVEARRFLYRKTRAYAESSAGQNPDRNLIPHPATWFNRGSYFDDPQEWNIGGNNGKVTQSISAKQGVLESRRSRRVASESDNSRRGIEAGTARLELAGERGAARPLLRGL